MDCPAARITRRPTTRPVWAAGLSGVFSHCDWSAGLNEIPDGSSNTIAIGEIRPLCGWHTRDGWMGDNALWIATTAADQLPDLPGRHILHSSHRGQPGRSPNGCAKWDSSRPIRADASSSSATARPISLSETIDYVTYQRLGDRRDSLSTLGEAVPNY